MRVFAGQLDDEKKIIGQGFASTTTKKWDDMRNKIGRNLKTAIRGVSISSMVDSLPKPQFQQELATSFQTTIGDSNTWSTINLGRWEEEEGEYGHLRVPRWGRAGKPG